MCTRDMVLLMAEEWVLFGSAVTNQCDVPLDPAAQRVSRPVLDDGLQAVLAWFRQYDDLEAIFGSVFRQSIDEVLDGARTGRFDIQDPAVGKTERTYLGTKVEIVTRATFELAKGTRMDYTIAGHDIDAKFSLGGVWQIPTEAMGHLCLLMAADDARGTFKVGVIRIRANLLNAGNNKDGKKTLSSAGRAAIEWLVPAGRLPANQLLELPEDDRQAIFALRSGQQRVTELLRRFRDRIIERNTASTVACQRDPMKRCRDARRPLAAEGIIVLGHQNDSPRIAAALGLPVPDKGEFVSVRIVRAPAEDDGRPVCVINDLPYAIALPGEPPEAAPPIRY
jgi:hypothetical protein